MTAPTIKRPNTDLVGVAWAKLVLPLDADRIATRLPSDTTILRSGFVRWRSGLGGSPGASKLRRPVGAFECWAAPAAGSNTVPWGKASDLVETLFAVLDDELHPLHGVTVDLPNGYGQARVLAANALSEPVRVEGDPSGFARFDVDVELNWTEVPA